MKPLLISPGTIWRRRGEKSARVVQGNKEMKAALTQAESQFLSGDNPAVASADLQEILKGLTRDHGVQMTSTKVLTPREAGPYLEVPVQAQLSCTTGQLLTILYQLEHHKKLLFVPELEVNAPRWVAGAKTDAALRLMAAGGEPAKALPRAPGDSPTFVLVGSPGEALSRRVADRDGESRAEKP